MSASDSRRRPSARLSSLPEFELSFLYDDEDDPAEVSVFPARLGADLATNWITIDYGHAVSIERVR